MKTVAMLPLFFIVVSFSASSSEGADRNLEIADLSSTLRLDLTASPSNVAGGDDIMLKAKLTNTGKTPVVVLPANMLARVGHGIEPRCQNQLGMFGSSIAEGGVPPTEVEMARKLNPAIRLCKRGLLLRQRSTSALLVGASSSAWNTACSVRLRCRDCKV